MACCHTELLKCMYFNPFVDESDMLGYLHIVSAEVDFS